MQARDIPHLVSVQQIKSCAIIAIAFETMFEFSNS